jgi:hypothetical protein
MEMEIKQVSFLNEQDLLKYIKQIQDLFQNNVYSQIVYVKLLKEILGNVKAWLPNSQRIEYTIRNIVEADKSFILTATAKSAATAKSTATASNPYIKTFNLIPLTKSQNISDICELIFKRECKSIKEFIDICESKKYGLIVMNRIIPNPITYNVTQLLDWNESKRFGEVHKKEFGVDLALLDRNKTIDKIAVPKEHNKWNFRIDTHVFEFKNYDEDMNKYVVILDSLAHGYFRVLCNYMSAGKYFVLVSSIQELYKHCAGLTPCVSRISSLNAIVQQKAMPNIFIPIMINQDKIKEISTIIDPKYLRNNIYLRLNEEFQAILERDYKGGRSIKDNYTYAKVIHDEKFLCVFSNIITHEFHEFIYNSYDEYRMSHINLSEIMSSFMNTIYINQRSFVKGIHDYFKDNQVDFNDDTTPIIIKNHFNVMSKHVLDKLITSDSNLYQTVLYKINILKHSFI